MLDPLTATVEPGLGDDSPSWLTLLRDLPARQKALFGDTPGDAGQAAWAEFGIAMAYDASVIEV